MPIEDELANPIALAAALRASHEIGGLITRATTGDDQAVIAAACKTLGLAVGADIVALRSVRSDGISHMVAGWAQTAILDTASPPLRLREDADLSRPILTTSIEEMPLIGEDVDPADLRRWRTQSPQRAQTLFCPVLSNVRPAGFLCLVGDEHVRWGRDLIEVVTLIASLIGQFHLRVSADAVHQRRRALNNLVHQATHDLVNSDLDSVGAASDDALQGIGQLLGATSMSLWNLDHQGSQAERLGRWHVTGDKSTSDQIVPFADSPLRTTTATTPTIIDHLHDDLAYVFVPGNVGERPEICVAAARTNGTPWEEWECHALASFADTVALVRHRNASEVRLAATFHEAPFGISLRSLDGRLVGYNKAFLQFLGEEEGTKLPDRASALIATDLIGDDAVEWLRTAQPDRLSGTDFPYRRRDGSIVWGRVSIAEIGPKDARLLLTHIQDVTAHREAAEIIRSRASTDSLTSLANRHAITDTLERMLGASDAGRQLRPDDGDAPCTVILADLNRFKAVNDRHGHGAGDKVLIEVGRRLSAAVRPTDLIGRYGGDEFLVVLAGPISGSDAVAQAERLRECFAEPIDIGGGLAVTIGASLGIAIGLQGESPDEILARADAAMYAEKTHAYDRQPPLTQMRRSPRWAGDEGTLDLRDQGEGASTWMQIPPAVSPDQLARALAEGRIGFWAQPIVDVRTRRPLGVELLARWLQEDGPPIMPADFIPVAEETGQVIELGRQALTFASEIFQRWHDDPDLSGLGVNVNISPTHLAEGLLEDLHKLIPVLPPNSMLGIEFVETELAAGSQFHLAVLRGLRDRGIRVVIDDFGVGHSSLSRLQQFPASDLKLDKSFIDGTIDDEARRSFFKSVAGLLTTAGFPVTAEGVETAEQFELVSETNINTVQGFFFARPRPLDVTESMLREMLSTSRLTHP